MEKQELENITMILGELKNLPNAKLIEMMDKLSDEFDATKANIIASTYHLDKVEETYNRILKEFDSRK
jgi:predicted ATP-grasp superfamily ATP-dependent carboligase